MTEAIGCVTQHRSYMSPQTTQKEQFASVRLLGEVGILAFHPHYRFFLNVELSSDISKLVHISTRQNNLDLRL